MCVQQTYIYFTEIDDAVKAIILIFRTSNQKRVANLAYPFFLMCHESGLTSQLSVSTCILLI